MNSIYNISVNTNNGNDFYILLGDFLDEFYRADLQIKEAMLGDAPENMKNMEYVPFLASTAHKLANDCGIESPRWVFTKRCYS